jgi:hypothetical protein
VTSFPLSSGMDGSSPRLRCPRKHDASLEPRVATHLLLASCRFGAHPGDVERREVPQIAGIPTCGFVRLRLMRDGFG